MTAHHLWGKKKSNSLPWPADISDLISTLLLPSYLLPNSAAPILALLQNPGLMFVLRPWTRLTSAWGTLLPNFLWLLPGLQGGLSSKVSSLRGPECPPSPTFSSSLSFLLIVLYPP